jgi:lysophospholipid hydrolase
VILTRLQRVTFLAAHKYLGLTKEVIRTEKSINELSRHPLPTSFYELGGMSRLRQRFLPETKIVDGGRSESETDYFALDPPTPQGGHQRPFFAGRVPVSETPADGIKLRFRSRSSAGSPIRKAQHRNVEPEGEEKGKSSSSAQTNMKRSPSERAASFGLGPVDDFDLREAVMDCISKSIGLVQSSPSNPASPEASPDLASVDPRMSPRPPPFSSSFGSLSFLGVQGRDDDSTITGSSSSQATESDLDNEVEILYFPRDSTLVKASERNAGLYYVIDGFLDVFIPTEGTVLNELPRGTQEQKDPPQAQHLFSVQPGGIAGYLSSISGFPSYVDIKAKTDAYVGFLPARSLDKIMDRKPIVLLTLAKRLISLLSPLGTLSGLQTLLLIF